jgi:hypothetical protein
MNLTSQQVLFLKNRLDRLGIKNYAEDEEHPTEEEITITCNLFELYTHWSLLNYNVRFIVSKKV